jgi:hypothetical protein
MKSEKTRGSFYSFIVRRLMRDFHLTPKDNQFNIQSLDGEKSNGGIAYIFIPQDVTREDYINKCLRTNSISLINENERLDNVIISQNIINDLIFPETTNELGSGLVWIKLYPTNQMVAISTINKKDEIILDKENQINIRKENRYCSVSILGNPDENFLNIEVENKDQNNQNFSEINFKMLGGNPDSKFNIYSSGNIDLISKNKIFTQTNNSFVLSVLDEGENKEVANISYIKRGGFAYKDEFDNQIEISEFGSEINIGDNRILITKSGQIIVENLNNCNLKLKLKNNEISLEDAILNIESLDDSTIQLKTKSNKLTLSDAGINIDAGDKSVSINGDKNVLYSKIPDATQIIDVSEIGVSTKVKIGD